MTSDIQDLSVSESRTHTEMSGKNIHDPETNLCVQIIGNKYTSAHKSSLHENYPLYHANIFAKMETITHHNVNLVNWITYGTGF